MNEVEKKYLSLAQLKIEGERSSLDISFGFRSDDDADREQREVIPLPDRLYAVCDPYASDQEECVWTVSPNPDNCGWETDNGYPGYGLPKGWAEEIARRYNLVAEAAEAARGVVANK